MRLRPKSAFFPVTGDRRSGYTLVELLVAITLTLILMTAVVTVFGGVGDGIAKSRRAMEQFDRLRTSAQQLRIDLQGLTVTLDGRPARPEENRGYLEVIEGGILSVPVSQGGFMNPPFPQAVAVTYDTSGNVKTNVPDLSVGERGDILMFTTRNATKPFLGHYSLSASPASATLQSDVAEVAWFLRGKTLHRRMLLVTPGVAQNPNFAKLPASTFFANNDISARLVNGQLVPNSLGDLTKRENRFAHPVSGPPGFPFDARVWGVLGLPTLAECSSSWMSSWQNGTTPSGSGPNNVTQVDYWDNQTGDALSVANLLPDQYLNSNDGSSARVADDIVLTNVIGFDVKVWDPGAPVRSVTNAANQIVIVRPGDPGYSPTGTIVSFGAYVDLGWAAYDPNYSPANGAPAAVFQWYGTPQSGLMATASTARTYDSYCFSYENEGIYYLNSSGNPVAVPPSNYPAGLGKWPAGTSTNGLADDPNSSIVDGMSELITRPPYPVALRGIQVTIRCYEPDSRQIRSITIEQDFLPK